MLRKILLGFLATGIAVSLAHSGYSLGKYLAQRERAQAAVAPS